MAGMAVTTATASKALSVIAITSPAASARWWVAGRFTGVRTQGG